MLLAQPLERLVLSDLHTCAYVAVAVHEEGESTREVFAAWGKRLCSIKGGFHTIQPNNKITRVALCTFLTREGVF